MLNIDISYFQKINNSYGSKSKQDVDLHLLNRYVDDSFSESIDYHIVTRNGSPFELLIIRDKHSSYRKSIKSKHKDNFTVGDYIVWNGLHWLVTEVDFDDKTYNSGKMELCNWELIWQRQDGTIARYWCIDMNSTQYNSGESGNKYMTLGSAQHQLTIPYAPDTVVLNTPQRFYLDRNMEKPTCYKVTQNDTTAFNYGRGLLKITLTQEECNKEKDKLITLDGGTKAWIADYFSPAEASTSPENDYELWLTYTGTNLYTGGNAKHITAQLVNKFDNSFIETTYTWEILSDISEYLITSISKNTVSIKVIDNQAAIHSIVTLKVTTSEGYEKTLDLYVKM